MAKEKKTSQTSMGAWWNLNLLAPPPPTPTPKWSEMSKVQSGFRYGPIYGWGQRVSSSGR